MNTFGPKADNLNRLFKAGFNVPKFYVVKGNMKSQLNDAATLKRLATVFEDWLTDNGINSAAIRSSSSQEDSVESSFAGQYTTILDVRGGKDFTKAIETVLNSKPSSAYAKQADVVHAIIQQFVEPDISGVVFSVNPTTGSNEFVINAARGRGTKVVDGLEAEQYFVSRLNTKEYHLKSSSNQVSLLDQSKVDMLASLTLSVESVFASPQDIEWAFKDDILYVLQARPITRINHLKLWDSSNISESFPGIVMPLTFSVAKRGYMLGYKAQAYSSGLSWYDIEAHHRIFDSMIGIFNGKLYYNLLSWYAFIALFPGSSRNQKFLDDQIATEGEAIYQIPVKQSLGFKLKYITRILYRALFFRYELNKFYRRFARFEEDMVRMPQTGDSQLLMMQYSHIEQAIIPHFGRTLDNDFFVLSYHGWLKKLLNKWSPGRLFEGNNIIGLINGVLSAEQAFSLYRIAASFRADKDAIELLSSSKYKALNKHLAGSELQNSINEYIKVFGHRFAEDQKIEAVNPTLEPNGIYELMKVYVQLDEDAVNKRLSGSASASKSIEGKINKNLRLDQKVVYKILLNRLKHHLRLREKNRLLRGKVYGYMRILFPKVGQALEREGVIGHTEDIFYLQIEEIYQLMQGSLITNDLRDRIDKRRAAYKQYPAIEMPERFISKSMPSLEKVESINSESSPVRVRAKMTGLISSPGTIEGRVVVLSEPKIPLEPYDILVARHTDPGWTPLIALAKGVIVEYGGMLSHAAIVTRELGIPSIIGVENITKILKTGMRVRINTQSSSVEILD